MSVFRTDEDRKEYLRLMREMGERYGLRFLSWCLMDNHVHLVVVPSGSGSLARGIGEAHRRYTRYVNLESGAREAGAMRMAVCVVERRVSGRRQGVGPAGRGARDCRDRR